MKKVEMSLLKNIIDFRICLKWQAEFVLCVTQKRMLVLCAVFVTVAFSPYVRII
jgi:hypothetical protein